jgi:hypothetical protein
MGLQSRLQYVLPDQSRFGSFGSFDVLPQIEEGQSFAIDGQLYEVSRIGWELIKGGLVMIVYLAHQVDLLGRMKMLERALGNHERSFLVLTSDDRVSALDRSNGILVTLFHGSEMLDFSHEWNEGAGIKHGVRERISIDDTTALMLLIEAAQTQTAAWREEEADA